MRVSYPRHRDRQLKRLPALLGFLLAFCIFNSSAYAQCTSPPGNDGTKEWIAAGGEDVTSGLVSRWALDESSGTNAPDSVGSNNGTLVNGPVWQPTGGQIDGALQFDGNNDRLNIAHHSSLDFGTGDFSIGGWVKGNYTLPSGEYPRLFEKAQSAPEQGVYLRTSGSNTDDYPSCTVASAGTTIQASATGYSVRDNNWHHVMCVKNSAGVKIYVDGVERGSDTGSIGSINTTFAASIGWSRMWGSDYYQGQIDDVRVYDRALSPSEMTTLYNYSGGGGGSTAGTYKFCIDGDWVDLTEDGTLGACSTEADWDYDTTEKTFKQCDGTDWQKITCAAGGGSNWSGNVIFTPAEIGGNCLPGAENTFTQVANLPQSKDPHVATLLMDGRVLFCGGGTSSSAVNRCDIYDPLTDSFTQVANMPVLRKWHSSSLLNDGRVLICGGVTGTVSQHMNRCDIYNPSTDSFTQVASMPQSKGAHASATLADGRVLICGGYTGSNTNRCDTYNPSTDSFTQVANMPQSKNDHTMTTLDDGRVLVCGGNPNTNRCDIYNPSTDSFTQVANMPQTRWGHKTSLLSDGKVLICGGYVSGSGVINQCHIYDPLGNNFTQVANLPSNRYYHGMTPLADGRALVCGGEIAFNGSSTNRCDIYNYNCGGGSPATIADSDTNGTLGPFLGSVGGSFTVSGSSSNDGSFTADAIPDNDTIEVSETLTTEGPVAVTITTGGGGGGGPTGCPTIGDVCSDGSIFAGDTDMYAADVDQSTGAYWSTEEIVTGVTSTSDGAANQAWIVANETLSQYPAFQLCENLNRHGHTDWYLPAQDELGILSDYRDDINGLDVEARYWSSTEDDNNRAWAIDFDQDGVAETDYKIADSYPVRCVRRDSGGGGGGGGGVTLENSASAYGMGSGTSYTLNFGFTATAGRLLVLAATWDKDISSPSETSSEWTQVAFETSGSDSSGAMYYKVADGDETSATLSWSNSRPMKIWVGEYSGLVSSSPLDRSSSADSGGSSVTSQSTGSTSSTTQADTFGVAIMGADTDGNVAGSRAWTNGFSEVHWAPLNSNDPALSVATATQSSAAAVETTFSSSGSDQMVAILAVFKQDTSGGGGGASCTSLGSCSTAGQMQYDTTGKIMMYCDGTDWYPLAEATP